MIRATALLMKLHSWRIGLHPRRRSRPMVAPSLKQNDKFILPYGSATGLLAADACPSFSSCGFSTLLLVAKFQFRFRVHHCWGACYGLRANSKSASGRCCGGRRPRRAKRFRRVADHYRKRRTDRSLTRYTTRSGLRRDRLSASLGSPIRRARQSSDWRTGTYGYGRQSG